MNTFNKEFLINHGFKDDADKKVLSGLFTKHSKFKEVNISVNLTDQQCYWHVAKRRM